MANNYELDKISKCPFCGAEAKLEDSRFGDSSDWYYRVRCEGKDWHALDDWRSDPQEAIELWNQRS